MRQYIASTENVMHVARGHLPCVTIRIIQDRSSVKLISAEDQFACDQSSSTMAER